MGYGPYTVAYVHGCMYDVVLTCGIPHTASPPSVGMHRAARRRAAAVSGSDVKNPWASPGSGRQRSHRLTAARLVPDACPRSSGSNPVDPVDPSTLIWRLSGARC